MAGKKNGELLKLTTENKFDLFVTVDRILQYQQNLELFSITIVVLCTLDNRRATLQKLIPKLIETIKTGDLQKVIETS